MTQQVVVNCGHQIDTVPIFVAVWHLKPLSNSFILHQGLLLPVRYWWTSMVGTQSVLEVRPSDTKKSRFGHVKGVFYMETVAPV